MTTDRISISGSEPITTWGPKCLVRGTMISLFNGDTKPCELITKDDELLVWDFYEGRFNKAKPIIIMRPRMVFGYNVLEFSNGAKLGCAGSDKNKKYHRIYNKEAGFFTRTNHNETPLGTTTFTDDGVETSLVSYRQRNLPTRCYSIITDKHYNLFANGILTSCRLSNQYKSVDMKYTGDKLFGDEFIKEYLGQKGLRSI